MQSIFLRRGRDRIDERLRDHTVNRIGPKLESLQEFQKMPAQLVDAFQGVAVGDDRAVSQSRKLRSHSVQALAAFRQERVQIEAEKPSHRGTQAGHVEIGDARQGLKQSDHLLARGHLSQDVQPIADLRPSQFAQVAIQLLDEVRHLAAAHLGQRHRRAVSGDGVVPFMRVTVLAVPHQVFQVVFEVSTPDQVPDLLLQQRHLRRVEQLHLVVFVHQLHQFAQFTVSVGGGHRRRQVVDDDGMGTVLGLRPLAGVIDDERIEQGQIAQERVGVAVRRQADALAGQPFQGAVLAQVDHGIGAPGIAQPAVEGVVVMRWRQVGLMVDGVRVHAVAARRLQGHEDVAEVEAGQGDVVVVDVGLSRRRSPLSDHLTTLSLRKVVEPTAILGGRDAGSGTRQLFGRQQRFVVGTAVDQRVDQGIAIKGQFADGVTGIAHRLQDPQQRGRRVEADGVADLRRLAGRVGEDEGDALVAVRLAPQGGEAQGQARQAADAIGHGGVVDGLRRLGGSVE